MTVAQVGDVRPLVELRRSTSSLHARLEASLDLMSPRLSMERYCRLLERFRSLYVPLEHAIDIVGESDASAVLIQLGWQARRKVALLDSDLQVLHRAGREMCEDKLSHGHLPTVTFVNVVVDVPTALGALYVTEGATLGGQVIAPHVRAMMGKEAPVAFFGAYGDDVAARWASYRRVANAVLDSSDQVSRAVASARSVFSRFQTVLTA